MKDCRWLCLALALALLCGIPAQAAGTAEELYAQAVEDAKSIEPEELLPLKTTLTRDDPYAQWNKEGDRVLVCTWNDTPADYPDGAAVTVGEEPVWTFSPAEFEAWYATNADGVEDWELRLCQLIGLPPGTGYTHFTTLWADPSDLLRPAFDPDVTTNTMGRELTGEDWYQSWFEDNTAASYGADGYPWTRLGYTYDWADNGTEYGLTEFILPTGAEATVERTVTTQEYLDGLAAEEMDDCLSGELDELNGKRLGVATGSVFDQVALARLPDAQVSYFDAQPEILAALLAGRVDAMITDEPLARDILRQTPGVRIVPEMFRTDSYAFAFPKDHTALRDQVNAALAELEADGTLAEMDARWFGEDEDARVLPDLPLTGEKGVIRFATVGSNAPFAFVKDGQIVGYDIEAAVRICHKLGYGLEITDMDIGALIPGVQAGRFDMAGACITVTEERKQSLLFSDADYTGGIVAIVRADTAADGSQSLWDSLCNGFYKTFLLESRWKMFARGLGVTLLISAWSAVLGTVLGFGLCMLCRSKRKWVCAPARAFVRLIQGIPVLVLLMILYFLVLQNVKNSILVAVVGFSINFAVYVSEMMRTGIETVDSGQLEAAQALGFGKARAFWKVTAPQALRTILPVYRGEFISMVKATSVVGSITIQDLTRVSDIVQGLTFNAFFSLISTALIYFALANLLGLGLSVLEKRLDPKRRKRIVKGVVME